MPIYTWQEMAADPIRKLSQRFDIDVESAARAMKNMPARSLLALQVVVAADDGVARKKLCDRLRKIADKSRARDPYWPSNLRRRLCRCGHFPSEDYLLDLVELVVQEFENPAEFGNPRLRARWFGLSERCWLQLMLQPYQLLQETLDHWYCRGLTQLQKHADCTDF